jgi:hypothetical protein
MTSQQVAKMGPRIQTIANPNKHELEALLRAEKAARRIGPNHSDVITIKVPGQRPMYAVKVVRLADPPPRWRRRLWVGAGGVSTLSVLGAMVWHARHVLMTGALIIAVVAALFWLASRVNHRGACAGLHCSGCKG